MEPSCWDLNHSLEVAEVNPWGPDFHLGCMVYLFIIAKKKGEVMA